nr:hypothetical protein [Tanacetum cinerariifolium]
RQAYTLHWHFRGKANRRHLPRHARLGQGHRLREWPPPRSLLEAKRRAAQRVKNHRQADSRRRPITSCLDFVVRARAERAVPLGLCLLGATATYAQSKKPLYQDRTASTEARVQDLLARMTTEEKVGQLSTLLGWEMYQKDGQEVSVSAAYKKAVDERHI